MISQQAPSKQIVLTFLEPLFVQIMYSSSSSALIDIQVKHSMYCVVCVLVYLMTNEPQYQKMHRVANSKKWGKVQGHQQRLGDCILVRGGLLRFLLASSPSHILDCLVHYIVVNHYRLGMQNFATPLTNRKTIFK